MSNKTLIIYALYEETVETDFFLDNGIIDDENVDYIFVVNDLNFSPSEKFSKTTANLSDRCSVFYRENIGYDFGGYAYAVDHITKNKKIDSYDFFVFLNQTVIGPIFPAWYKCSKNNWAELFTNKITETVKISGASINCFYFDMEKQEWIYSPHVQTMLFATDRVGLDIGIKKRILSYDNVMADKMWVVMAKEIEFSKSVLEAGYNISCLLSRAKGINFKEGFEGAWKDPWFPEGDLWVKENIHPYETVFFKNNRKITPNLITNLKGWKATTQEFQSLWENKENYNNFIKMFERVYSFFVDKNLCPMICFGTLLGCRRHDGKQIPWDGDIDIVLYKDEFIKVYDEFIFVMENSGYSFSAEGPYAARVKPKVYPTKLKSSCHEFWIDIYFWEKKENVKGKEATSFCNYDGTIRHIKCSAQGTQMVFFHGNGQFCVSHDYNDIFPLKKSKFEGVEVYVPNNIDKILDTWYPNWDKQYKSSMVNFKTKKTQTTITVPINLQ